MELKGAARGLRTWDLSWSRIWGLKGPTPRNSALGRPFVPLPTTRSTWSSRTAWIDLSADKPAVFSRGRPGAAAGGRVAVSDVVADPEMEEATRRDIERWTGCIAGALTEAEFRHELQAAGFEQIKVRPTQGPRARGSAIIAPGSRVRRRAQPRSLSRMPSAARRTASPATAPGGHRVLDRLQVLRPRARFRALPAPRSGGRAERAPTSGTMSSPRESTQAIASCATSRPRLARPRAARPRAPGCGRGSRR